MIKSDRRFLSEESETVEFFVKNKNRYSVNIRAGYLFFFIRSDWFRAAALPLDKELEIALLYQLDAKRCAVCGALFRPGSNRAKYCPDCAAAMKRIRAAERKRKQRAKCHALGAEKAL